MDKTVNFETFWRLMGSEELYTQEDVDYFKMEVYRETT